MCDECGCQTHDHGHGHSHSHDDSVIVDINRSLFAANDAMARSNREHFDAENLVVVNLISSPGSGKTTLLEHTIDRIGKEIKIGVIEGDIETERDAERIRAKGVPAVQLTTGGACHLDASMIHRASHQPQKEAGGDNIELLAIEKVVNLVCPTTFDLGEHQRVVLVSVPEGPDKPAKYPKAFTSSQLFLITKTDLLPYFDFEVAEATREALNLNPALEVMDFSSTTEEGLDVWLDYLRELVIEKKQQ